MLICNLLSITVEPLIVAPTDGSVFTINETDTFSVTCNATGIPVLMNFMWLKDGTVQNYTISDANVTISDPSTPVPYYTNGGIIWSISQTLTFISAMDEDSGSYTCMASNGIGSGDTINIVVVVQSKNIYHIYIDVNYFSNPVQFTRRLQSSLTTSQ